MLRLTQHPNGVTTEPGDRVVYDVDQDEAHYGAARVDGHALVWELAGPTRRRLAAALRPGRLPAGRRRVPAHASRPRPARPAEGADPDRDAGGVARVRAARVVVRDRPDPVYAAASDTEETAFVRVLVLPAEWAGKRTIAYVDPADEEKPKLQRARIYFEQPL